MSDRAEPVIVGELPLNVGGPCATPFRVGSDEYIAISFPGAEAELPSVLTASERCVFQALLTGKSNREIASGRRRSLRTVANQVAAIFTKLGVGSRAELFAKYNALL